MRRIVISTLGTVAWLVAGGVQMERAAAQSHPGGAGQMSGGRGSMHQPEMDNSSPPTVDKPDSAARKAFNAGVKSLKRAHDFEEAAAKAPNAGKKADALDKANDAYGRALDQFTEVLRNNGAAADAWSNVGYIHLRLGAYNESIDDYNHALALKPEMFEAIQHRGEAYMAFDRLDEAKAAYMNLFNHARPLADQLMAAMRQWLENHRVAATVKPAPDIDSFDKWLQEHEGIAKQTASATGSNPQ